MDLHGYSSAWRAWRSCSASAAAVVLLGVLAVRVSVRLGLPSLLLYLGIGVLLGESVLGIQFSDAALTESLGLAALVLILIEGGLTTRWTAVRPSLGVGHRAVHGGGRGEHRGGRGGAAPAARPGLAHRVPVGRGAVRPPTPRRCSACCAGSGCRRGWPARWSWSPGMNDAPVVLAVVLLASGDPITWLTPAAGGLRAGRGRGDRGAVRARRGVGAAPGRAAVHRSVPAGDHRGVRAGLLRPGSSRTPPACWPPTSPRWCWATPTCRTAAACARSPRASAGWPRSGCSCCSGCTPRRRGCSTRVLPALVAGRGAGAGWRGRCRCCSRPPPFRVPVAGAGVPVLVGAARGGADRAGADRADRGRAAAPAAGRRGVRAGRGADPGAGHHAAVGGPAARACPARGRPREIAGRRRAAGRAGRRPAAGPGPGRLQAARGLPAGAAAAPGRHGQPGGARRARGSPRTRRPGCASATSCWSSPPPRSAAATEERLRAVDRARPAGPLAAGSAPGAGRDRAPARVDRATRLAPARDDGGVTCPQHRRPPARSGCSP